jgi:hypothetical protein
MEEIYPALYCDTTGMITYQNEIKPLFQVSCGATDISCHMEGALQVNLNDYDETKDVANGGELVGSILHESGFVPMPQSRPKLHECDINKIIAWVNREEPQ